MSSLESTDNSFEHLNVEFSNSLSLSIGESNFDGFLSGGELLLSGGDVEVLYGDALGAVDINGASGVNVGETSSGDELQSLSVQEFDRDDAGDELVDFVFVTGSNTGLTIVAGDDASLNILSGEDELVVAGDGDSHLGKSFSGGVDVEFGDLVFEVVKTLRKDTGEAELRDGGSRERSLGAKTAEHVFWVFCC